MDTVHNGGIQCKEGFIAPGRLTMHHGRIKCTRDEYSATWRDKAHHGRIMWTMKGYIARIVILYQVGIQ